MKAIIWRLVLASSLALPAAPITFASDAEAATTASAKKKRKQRKKRRRARKTRKITSKTIKRWHRKGWSEKKILSRLEGADYKPTKLALKRLRRSRVPKRIVRKIAALNATNTTRTGFRMEILQSDDDIDFDSIPAPETVSDRGEGETDWARAQKRPQVADATAKPIRRRVIVVPANAE